MVGLERDMLQEMGEVAKALSLDEADLSDAQKQVEQVRCIEVLLVNRPLRADLVVCLWTMKKTLAVCHPFNRRLQPPCLPPPLPPSQHTQIVPPHMPDL